MGFAGVYRAVYGYNSTSEQELSLKENDLLYLIETADDGWWTVKKRVPGVASKEPEGIVPYNYIEPAKPEAGVARALYSYEKQTSEEVSFVEGSQFHIYATDGDWVLVGTVDSNEFGFVPNNYIEKISNEEVPPNLPENTEKVISSQPEPSKSPVYELPLSKSDHQLEEIRTEADAPPRPTRPNHQRPTREVLDRELPQEPRVETKHVKYPITDISGRRRIAKTLVIASTYVTLINDDGGGRTQKWDVPNIRSYSSEKKHVFLDLENPSASLELKASSQLEADRIVSSLGQIVGAGRGGGLQEVLAAAKTAGHKQGQIVLDFKAANSRELSVSEFETVFVINDTDKDWWLVRNISGKEGIVPRKFVHLDKEDGKLTDFFRNSKRKSRSRDKEHEREHNSARQAAKALHREKHLSGNSGHRLSRQHGTHHDRTLPDSRKLRMWIDRSGSYKVDAQLLGCSDGKVHLHKANGVKIAVPASKLSSVDVDYVESVTGVSLSEDVPLSERSSHGIPRSSKLSREESLVKETNSRNDFWLSFFLSCGVDPQNSNRYAKNFTRDNMDSSSLKDVNSSVLRTLGLREGDILRVTNKINEDLGRVQNPEGGLYSNNGGALQNNTGTTATAVENQAWTNGSNVNSSTPGLVPQQASGQMLSQPSLQPHPTAGLTSGQTAPQKALSSAPSGALADLMGVTSPQPTCKLNAAQQLPNLAAATTGFSALNAQNTAEAKLVAQQRQTQHQILRQQAQLQAEQIKLLREQQEQLRQQQNDLIQIQKTGSQITALGPFATGVAGIHMQNPSVAASMLSAPPPPQPRDFQPNFTAQPSQVVTHTTGPFIQQRTGPMAQAGSLVQSQATGPFVQSQPTGPFAGVTQFAPQTTGPFTMVSTKPITAQPTGPFASIQQPLYVGPQSVPFTSFGLVQPTQANLTNSLANFSLTGQRTGTPGLTGTGANPPSAQILKSNPLLQNQAPFGQSTTNTSLFSQATGPFQGSTVQQIPTTTFGNQFQIPQQTFQPVAQQQPEPFGSIAQPFPSSNPTGNQFNSLMQNQASATMPSQSQFMSRTQPTGQFQGLQNQQPSYPQTSFGQIAPQQVSQIPLQSQATGFGFGNQAHSQPQTQQRANLTMASANNPFGL